jgi:hypothetical protein
MLTPQQIQQAKLKTQLSSQTTSSSGRSFLDSLKNSNNTSNILKEKPSFIAASRDIVSKGSEELGSIADKYGSGEQGLASSALQTAGTAAKSFSDIGFEALKRVTPGFIKEPIKKGITKVAETETAQKAVNSYSNWAKDNPEKAANLEATANLASIYPTSKAGSILTNTAGKAAKETGQKLIVQAEKSAIDKAKDYVYKLVKPIETKANKISDVSRTVEKGDGIFKRSVIAPTKEEGLMAKAVGQIKGIKPENTFQQNFNIIKQHTKELANSLRDEISSYKIVVPRKEIMSKLNKAAKSLKESPLIVGDAEKTAERLLLGAKKIISENTGDVSGLLKARKQFDNWVLSQKPKAFDATAENAFSLANREIRNSLNDLLDSKIPNVKLKEKLATQHQLMNAMDNIAPKAAQEANTSIGRAFQKAKGIIGTRNEAFNTAAAGLGLGGIAAGSAAFTGPAAAIGIPAFLIYKAGKIVVKPEFRQAAGKMLKTIGETLQKTTNPVEIKALNEANSVLKRYLIDVGDTAKQDLLNKNPKGFVKLPEFNKTIKTSVDPKVLEIRKTMDRLKSQLLNAKSETTKKQIQKAMKKVEEESYNLQR